LNSPWWLRNAEKRDKKIEQTNRGRKRKKTEGKKKKATFFVMSPEPFRVFELPLLLRNAKKTRYQIIQGGKKSMYLLFFGAAANVRHFRLFFSTAPLAPGVHNQEPNNNKGRLYRGACKGGNNNNKNAIEHKTKQAQKKKGGGGENLPVPSCVFFLIGFRPDKAPAC
jgi:hypothetical protein